MSLILIGFTHSGKTIHGRAAAKELGVEFVDTDHIIEEHVHMPLRTFFQQEGELAFRELEERVCKEIAKDLQRKIIALGGGAPAAMLCNAGRVVYLRAAEKTLLKRIKTFPPFAPNKEALLSLMQSRFSFYTKTAHFVIDVEVESVTKRLMELFHGL